MRIKARTLIASAKEKLAGTQDKFRGWKRAKKKGRRPIGINFIDATALLSQRLEAKGYSQKHAALLATRIATVKKALNRMGIGNRKKDLGKMK